MKQISFEQIPVELEIISNDFPSVFFEKSPFLIPKINERVEAPIISIERHLGLDDAKKTDSFLNMIARFRDVNRQLGIENKKLPEEFSFLSESIVDVKEYYVKQDLHLLVDLVDKYFRHESERINIDLDNLPDDTFQIVEIDFTMIDLYPGDTEIHYRLYTKRGIGRRAREVPI